MDPKQSHATLAFNLENATEEGMGEGRKKETLDGLFWNLTAGIQTVGLDMVDSFMASILDQVPSVEEKMIFDRFHMAKHANEEWLEFGGAKIGSSGPGGTRRSRRANTSGSPQMRAYRRSIGTTLSRSGRSTSRLAAPGYGRGLRKKRGFHVIYRTTWLGPIYGSLLNRIEGVNSCRCSDEIKEGPGATVWVCGVAAPRLVLVRGA